MLMYIRLHTHTRLRLHQCVLKRSIFRLLHCSLPPKSEMWDWVGQRSMLGSVAQKHVHKCRHGKRGRDSAAEWKHSLSTAKCQARSSVAARWMGDCARWMGDCATWMGDCYVLGFAPSSLKSSLKSKLMCRLYTRSLEEDYEPKSPGCAHMQKDDIRTFKSLHSMSEFSGSWKLTHTHTHTHTHTPGIHYKKHARLLEKITSAR